MHFPLSLYSKVWFGVLGVEGCNIKVVFCLFLIVLTYCMRIRARLKLMNVASAERSPTSHSYALFSHPLLQFFKLRSDSAV